MTVYVVDDSEIFRARLVGLLRELEGVTLIGVSESAGEAIEAINHHRPDVVLLDVRLKSGTGIDVLRSVGAGSVTPFIIVMSNYDYPQYKEACARWGAHLFFHKSTEFYKIVDAVRERSLPPLPEHSQKVRH